MRGQTIRCDTADFVVLSRQVLEAGGSVRFQAKGDSMCPSINDGDFVVVEPCDTAQLQVGDIILYRVEDGAGFVHRVLSRRAGNKGGLLFVTKGDALGRCDSPVASHRVLGRVTGVERAKGLVPIQRGILCWIRVFQGWSVEIWMRSRSVVRLRSRIRQLFGYRGRRG